ncbi:hypothetical protein H4R26_004605 [Coemansia thaxteri]|uniref:Uncharacterized protein n=1 Tax=Coemansia thaxteri TaxID=2663907 RepID=A0A9W8BCE6_9FUNG|nr:hypothetical protein H4R26_004605 [Coemansia thaxteri]
MMTDLDLDSKAILSGLVYLDQHNSQQAPAAGKAAAAAAGGGQAGSKEQRRAGAAAGDAALAEVPAAGSMSPKTAARHFSSAGPHAIASLKVETSAVLKELARFRACDDQTMSCFYCREWAQWVYRKQISPQAAANGAAAGGAGTGAGAGGGGGGGRKKKSKTPAGAAPAGHSSGGGGAAAAAPGADPDAAAGERRRAVRQRYATVAELCESLRGMVADERRALAGDAGGDAAAAEGADAPHDASHDAPHDALSSSTLISDISERVTLWYEGHAFPLADVYEDLTFDFSADAFPYDDHQDPLDPALLLPALQVTRSFVGLAASDFALLGNITSELIATHAYPTCQHTKADHATPAELETQRLIFNAQLGKWRADYRRSFEREMEPVWQITHLLLKSAQRIDAMRVRLFARGCRANRQQFLQTIRTRTQPFADFWPAAAQAAADAAALDALVAEHLDNVLDVGASWSRTFLESYYGVAREFARELETILGECITMCDRRALGLKYPPPLTLQPQLDGARAAIGGLLPRLDARISRIQRVVAERGAEIRSAVDDMRRVWAETSGPTAQTKLARAAQKDVRKRMRRIEFQQQTGVIAWAMRELELLLTAPDVAAVIADCLELLMTEAEILERAVAQVFVRKLEPTADDLREQRQDIVDDFTEGLLTGREELAGVVGKLMLKEAWRILEANISLQRQKALLDGAGPAAPKPKKAAKALPEPKKEPAREPPAEPAPERMDEPPLDPNPELNLEAILPDDDLLLSDNPDSKRRKKNKKNKKKKAKGKSAAAAASSSAAAPSSSAKAQPPPGSAAAAAADATLHAEDDEDDDYEEEDADDAPHSAQPTLSDPRNPFNSLSQAEAGSGSGSGSAQPAASSAAAGDAAPTAAAPSSEPQLRVVTQAQAQAQTRDDVPPPAKDAKPARSRRGTNAARYVPGVGFVSDDGVSTTSPQLAAAAATTTSAAAVSAVSGALRGVQAGSVAARTTTANGRMSPLSAARLVSPVSRPQSPLVTAAAGERRALDKDALSRLQAALASGPVDVIERTVAGLPHESLAALATSAIVESRRSADAAVEWNKAVDKVLLTYDLIAAQIGSLKTLCETHDSEAERLSAQLLQATQEAQHWRDHCERLCAEVDALKLEAAATSMGENTAAQAAAPSSSWLGAGAGSAAAFGQQQQQQQPPLGFFQQQPQQPFASAAYSQQQQQQFASMMHHHPAGFMPAASSYAAAVAAIQAQALAQQQQPPQQQQQFASLMHAGSGRGSGTPPSSSSMAAGATATAASSASLLTALNARSQAF